MEEHIWVLFQLLSRYNRLRLPAVRFLVEVGRIYHSNYCLFHWTIGHPTKNFCTLKITLQAINDVQILKLHPEQKMVELDTSTAEDNPSPSFCNVVCALLKDIDSDVPALIDSEHKTIVLAVQARSPLVPVTHSGQSYIK